MFCSTQHPDHADCVQEVVQETAYACRPCIIERYRAKLGSTMTQKHSQPALQATLAMGGAQVHNAVICVHADNSQHGPQLRNAANYIHTYTHAWQQMHHHLAMSSTCCMSYLPNNFLHISDTCLGRNKTRHRNPLRPQGPWVSRKYTC